MRHILLIPFSHRSHDNVSPLRTASEFLYFPHAHPRFSYNIHVVEWVSTVMPTLPKPRTLSSLILLTFVQHWKSPPFCLTLSFLTLLIFLLLHVLLLLFFSETQSPPTSSRWLFPIILFQPSSLDSVYILESPRSPPTAPTPQ